MLRLGQGSVLLFPSDSESRLGPGYFGKWSHVLIQPWINQAAKGSTSHVDMVRLSKLSCLRSSTTSIWFEYILLFFFFASSSWRGGWNHPKRMWSMIKCFSIWWNISNRALIDMTRREVRRRNEVRIGPFGRANTNWHTVGLKPLAPHLLFEVVPSVANRARHAGQLFQWLLVSTTSFSKASMDLELYTEQSVWGSNIVVASKPQSGWHFTILRKALEPLDT